MRPPLRTELPRSEPLRASAQPALAAVPQAPQPVGRAAETGPTFARFADLIAFVAERRDLPLKTLLERDVRLVRFEDGKLEVALEPSASRALISDLARKLTALTGRRWMVVVSTEAGEPTVKAQADARRTEFMAGVQSDPRVQDVLARFPGAQIVAVREPDRSLAAAPPPAPVDDDEPPPDMPPYDDELAFGAHRRRPPPGASPESVGICGGGRAAELWATVRPDQASASTPCGSRRQRATSGTATAFSCKATSSAPNQLQERRHLALHQVEFESGARGGCEESTAVG